MANNGSKLCVVVPGVNAHIYDGSTLTRITDPDFRVSDIVVFKDGYFVFSSSDGSANLPLSESMGRLNRKSKRKVIKKLIQSTLTHNEFVVNLYR